MRLYSFIHSFIHDSSPSNTTPFPPTEFCPNDCSGNDHCIDALCVCNENFDGEDCSYGAIWPLSPPLRCLYLIRHIIFERSQIAFPTAADCPNACSGNGVNACSDNGVCFDSQCYCNYRFRGEDRSISLPLPPQPLTLTPHPHPSPSPVPLPYPSPQLPHPLHAPLVLCVYWVL